ncbi:MAG: helix-hairpin-helix domain-containing protein [Bacilli bacterium]|nr:helix-hairpin-helix domain-containing protein [Bacilli bacterium]
MKKILMIISVLLLLNLFNNNYTKALEIDKIIVDIKGAVNNPGVYEVEVGSTVYDLIGIAGGLRSYADTSLINLSKRLSDEDVVIVYTIDEVSSMTKGDTAIKVIEKECVCPKVENVACVSKTSKKDIGIININTASLEELQKLSGIGKSKAQAIIDYRTSTPFKTPEDIMNVKGIGKSTYEKNKDNIGV